MRIAITNKWIISVFILLMSQLQGFVSIEFGVCYAQQRIIGRAQIADSVNISDRQIKAAIAVWQKYTAAMRADDRQKASQYWNNEESERGAIYNIRVHSFERYQMMMTDLVDKVVNAEEIENGYIKLHINWYKNNSEKAFFSEILYAMLEGDKFVLASPLIARTRNWEEYETEYLVYHHHASHRFSPKNAAAMDSFIKNLLDLFQVDLKCKIAFYIVPPKLENSELERWGLQRYGLGGANGQISLIVDWGRDSEYFPHEIVHIIHDNLSDSVPILFLAEGMATYFGGADISIDAILSNLKEELIDVYVPPIDSLIQLSYKKSNLSREENHWIRYVGAATVGYLYQTFGREKFKQFYINASVPPLAEEHPQHFIKSLREIYDMTLPELDENYRKWLHIQKFERIEFGISENVKPIVTLYDPEGDDNGDGSYAYPKMNKRGVCDLKKVEIFEDSDRLYFNLIFGKFNYLTDTTHTWPGACLIALDTNPFKSDRIDFYPIFNSGAKVKDNDAFEFEIYFNTMWISLIDEKSEFLDLQKDPKQMSRFFNHQEGRFTFSLSKKIIGEPDENWKIGIAVGLTDDKRGRPFFYDVNPAERKLNCYDVLDSNEINRTSIYTKGILPMVRMY